MNRSLLILLLSVLTAIPASADEIGDFCSRRAAGTVAELRHEHYPALSQRETEIARKSAIIACIDSRTSSSTAAEGSEAVVSEQVNESKEEDKKSWMERLMESKGKEDVSPMMGVHRTGGK